MKPNAFAYVKAESVVHAGEPAGRECGRRPAERRRAESAGKLEHAPGTPACATALGAAGCGEAGTIAVSGAIVNAVNDAWSPVAVELTSQPFTPEKVLRAPGALG